MTRWSTEIRAAAYHEAGHAVASWRLGDGIGGITIEPGQHTTGEPTGGHFLLRRAGDRSMASGWGFRHLVVILAGPAAQRIHNPRSAVRSCGAIDLRTAADFAFVMSASRRAARALLSWAHAEARARVVADWPLVEVLAAALHKAVTLTGEDATAILVAAEQAERRDLAETRAALTAAV